MKIVPSLGKLWSSFTSFLTSRDLVRLYKTGNKELRNILEKEGGVEMIVHVIEAPAESKGSNPHFFSKSLLWPKLLLVRFRNHLKSFHIVGFNEMVCLDCDPDMASIDFQVLPASLTSLIIPFHFTLTEEMIQLLPPQLKRLRLGKEFSMKMFDFSHLPRSLTSLELPSHKKLTDEAVQLLPPGLLRLDLPVNTCLSTNCFAHLPRSLTHLDLSQMSSLENADEYSTQPLSQNTTNNTTNLKKIEDSRITLNLPPNLLFLSLASVSHLSNQMLRCLPKSLTHLELTSVQIINDDAIKCLPRTLKFLSLEFAIGNYTQLGIPYLPPSLTKLSMGITNQLSQIGINALPKTLVHLSLDQATSLGSLKRNINLPSLTYLSLGSCNQFDDKTIGFLPKSLTVLNLGKSTKISPKGLALLPKGITFLSIQTNTLLTEKASKYVPESIIKNMPMPLPLPLLRGIANDVVLKGTGSISTAFIEAQNDTTTEHNQTQQQKSNSSSISNTGYNVTISEEATNTTIETKEKTSQSRFIIPIWAQEHLTNSTFLKISNNLEYLDITHSTEIDDDVIELLPQNLKELYLPLTMNLSSSKFRSLPRKLETLYYATEYYAKLPISGSNEHPLSVQTILDNIPEFYPSEILPSKVYSKASGEHFVHLPADLSALIIQNYIFLRDEHVPHLPRNLSVLVLIPDTSLTNDCLLHLPRQLTYLNLSTNPRFTDEGMKDLPPGLKYLNLSSSRQLSDACIHNLPRTLETLILSSSNKFTDEALRACPRSLTMLNMDSSNQFSDQGIPHLPPGLTSLSLQRARKLTDSCIRHMPRSLTVLKLTKNSILTRNCFFYLPSKIRLFEAVFNQPNNPEWALERRIHRKYPISKVISDPEQT